MTISLAVTAGRQVVGNVAVSDPVWKERRAWLGWWLIAAHRGKGYATRAAALVRDWALAELPLDELRLQIEPGNEDSAALARRLGAEPTGEQATAELHGETHVLGIWVIRRS